MTGSTEAAAQIFDHTVERAASHFTDIRCPRRAARWLFAEARANCRRHLEDRRRSKRATAPAAAPAAGGTGEPAETREAAQTEEERAAEFAAAQLAAAFAPLPEPERCALALFYLMLFPAAELAEVLGIRPRELPPLLSRGRALLRGQPAMAGLAVSENDLLRC